MNMFVYYVHISWRSWMCVLCIYSAPQIALAIRVLTVLLRGLCSSLLVVLRFNWTRTSWPYKLNCCCCSNIKSKPPSTSPNMGTHCEGHTPTVQFKAHTILNSVHVG